MRRMTLGLASTGLALVFVLSGAEPARATMDIQKKAKTAGFEATNCQYCHVEKMPKKGAETPNDRGKWLLAQKETKKAKEVDVAWLKDYVEPKK